MGTCHEEHSVSMMGTRVGRSGGPYSAWEPCRTTPHHEHPLGFGEDFDVECCICSGSPCDAVDRDAMLRHRDYDKQSAEQWGEIHAREKISNEISAALDAIPDGTLGPDAEQAWRTCWVIARGNIDEPPF